MAAKFPLVAALAAVAALSCSCTALVQSKKVEDKGVNKGLQYAIPHYVYRLTISPVIKDAGENGQRMLGGAGETPPGAFAPSKRIDPFGDKTIPTIATYSIPSSDKCAAFSIKLEGPIAIGDKAQRYVLRHDYSIFRDDQLGLVTDENGVLQSTDTTSKGQLDELIAILAKIVMTGVTGLPSPLPGPGEENQQAEGDRNFTEGQNPCLPNTRVIFDPTVAADMDAAGIKSTNYDTSPDDPAKPLESAAGLYYRSLNFKTWTLTGNNGFEHFQFSELLPVVTGPLGYIELTASLIGDDQGTAVRFKGGVPVSVDLKTQGEALALINIPYNIINAIMRLPLDLLTFRIQRVTKEKDLTTQQVALLQQIISLREQQEKLNQQNEQQNNNGNPAPAPGGGGQ